MTRPASPWYITIAACEQYAAILGIDPEDDADFNRCEDELAAVAQVATFHKISDGGLHEYRGKVPAKSRQLLRARTPEDKLVLLVSTEPRPEGPLPQLVRVKLRGRR